jgi:Mg-chelatase subunit ChlD
LAGDVAFVTDDDVKHDAPGCDAISVVDLTNGRAITRGRWHDSPGRLAVGQGGLALSVSNHSNDRLPFLYVLREEAPNWARSSTRVLGATRLQHGSSAAVALDDSAVLLARSGGGVERHDMASLDGRILGIPTAVLADVVAAEIVFGLDPSTAYVADTDGLVHVVDVDTMTRVGEPIPYLSVPGRVEKKVRNTNGAVSPDGRTLVFNTGPTGSLNVVDLATHSSVLIELEGVDETWGVEFNYAPVNHGLLAVHGRNAVAVYKFADGPVANLLSRTDVPAQRFTAWQIRPDWARVASLAWTTPGDAVVAAIGSGREFRVIDLNSGTQPLLKRRLDFDACTSSRNLGMPLDVVTLNRRAPLPTPSPSSTPTPTVSATKTPTPVPPTHTPSRTPTATFTLVRPTVTATPTETPTPGPIYLPLALREQCEPGKMTADVALVIDASTSMRNDRTQAGRTKLDAAVQAAEGFVDTMAMPQDQAAVVIFNDDARVLQGLTGRRADVAQALSEIPHQVRQQTRIDLGIEAGHAELMGASRNPQNRPVMIVLTDGLSNPVPASSAVRKASDARGDGVTIFTIGLGKDDELNASELREMASKPEYFYLAPDGEDLLAIYREIAAEIPCPSDAFWGGR